MASLNKVQIIGHIGADPVLNHTTTNQVPVVNLRVATNEGWTDNQGQKHENTTWHTVVCFKKLAQTVAQYMAKGRQVYIEGRLQVRPYMGQAKDANNQPIMMTNGQPLMVQKYATEIVAFNVQFLGKNPNANAYPQANVAVNPAGVVAPAGAPVVAAPGYVAPAGAPVAAAPAVNPAATFVTAPAAPVASDMTPPAGV
jgi:single-strand DNA-binding protein